MQREPRLAYMVIATLPSEAMAAEYVAWLLGGHVAAVVAGGAAVGEVIRLDAEAGGPPRVMSRYEFASRAAFERYVAEVAPGLRAEGLEKFGPSRGVRYERLVGEVRG
jgi:hypothetical protein